MAAMTSKELAQIADALKKESPQLYEEVFQNRTNPDAKEILKNKLDQITQVLGKKGIKKEELEVILETQSADGDVISLKTKRRVKWILYFILGVLLIQIIIVLFIILPKI